jgi:glycosyltransferase involved in cell wall biosynthesis
MPAYNAGKTIEATFGRIPAEVRERVTRYVVVDDGSTDDTAAALDRLAGAFPGLIVLRHEINRGYGAAEKALLAHARDNGAQAMILLHADGQYSPEKIPALLGPLDDGTAELVQGSRMLAGGAIAGGMPAYKYVANKCLTALENLAFGMKLAEYHSGFMVYGRPVLDRVPFARLSDSFDIDIEIMLCASLLGLRLKEIAIPTIYAGETSHLSPIRYGFDVLSIVRRHWQGYYRALLAEAVP